MYRYLKSLAVFLVVGSLCICFAVPVVCALEKNQFKGETLIVTTWSGPYEKNFRKAFVTPFEKLTGARIDLVPGWSEFITKIQTAPAGKPPYDVFLGTDRQYIQAKASGHLEELRLPNIPNWSMVWDSLRKMDGYQQKLGAPFDSAYMGMVFRNDAINFEPNSWQDLSRSEFNKKISLDHNFYYNLYLGAYLAGQLDDQGRVLLEPTEKIYNTMKDLASTNVYKWYGSGAEFVSLLERGEVAGGYYWSGTLYAKKEGGLDISISIPKEGTVAYLDYLCVLKGTKKRDLAEAFINYCLSDEAMSRFIAVQKNSVSNKNATVPDSLKGLILDSEEEWAKIQFIDWDYVLPNWDKLEEKWKKEVMPLVNK
jgi:spermidine/putrescine-binding protein